LLSITVPGTFQTVNRNPIHDKAWGCHLSQCIVCPRVQFDVSCSNTSV